MIHIQQTPSGKVTGIAHVDFNNEQECQEALKKDKQHIGENGVCVWMRYWVFVDVLVGLLLDACVFFLLVGVLVFTVFYFGHFNPPQH